MTTTPTPSTTVSAALSSIFSPIPTGNTTNTTNANTNATLLDPGIPGDLSDDDDTPTKGNTLLYYYFFIFLLLIVAVVVLSTLAYHRRKRLRKALHQNNGQNALHRDLEGWTPGNIGGFFSGRQILNRRANGDEGFNEYGEAPPAYKVEERRAPTDTSTGTSGRPTIPLRTLSRGHSSKLPEYDDLFKDRPLSATSTIPEETNEVGGEINHASASRETRQNSSSTS
jgi:hypothetical protein